MKNLILLLLFSFTLFRLPAQEGILNIVNNSNVFIGGAVPTNGGVFITRNTANNDKIIVASSKPLPNTSGNAIGEVDIHITILDNSETPIYHRIWGIPNAKLFPKDVIVVNNEILIVGTDSTNNENKGFVLRVNPSNNSSLYKTYDIDSCTNIHFHQILALTLPATLKNDLPQFAILASAFFDNGNTNPGFKDFVLLISQQDLTVNSTYKIDIGPNFNSVILGYSDWQGYRLMTEVDPLGTNGLCVAGSYINNNFNASYDFGIHITQLDFSSGDLVASRNVLFTSGSWKTGQWILPQHLVYEQAGGPGTGTLILAGSKFTSTSNADLIPFYMALDFSNLSIPLYTKELPVWNSGAFRIRGHMNSRIRIQGNDVFIGNNRGDLISFDRNSGSINFIKSITDDLRPTGALPVGDFVFDEDNSLMCGVTRDTRRHPISYFTMEMNNTDGCCFNVIVKYDNPLYPSNDEYIDHLNASAESNDLSIDNQNVDIEALTVCSYCNGGGQTIDGPNDVWCNNSIYTLEGCEHFGNSRWTLSGPLSSVSSNNLTTRIIAQDNNSVTINLNAGPSVLPAGQYKIRYWEESTDQSGDCEHVLAEKIITFHRLTCATGTINGPTTIFCQGSENYSLAGCGSFPTGTTYTWTLTNTAGPNLGSISSSSGTNAVVNFTTATGNSSYTLSVTASFGGCTWNKTLNINQVLPTPTGSITTIQSIDCEQKIGIFQLTNPEGYTITDYWWTGAGTPDFNDVNPVTYDFANLTGSLIINCDFQINGCPFQKQLTIIRQPCCPITNETHKTYQASYNTYDNQSNQTYSGKTLGILSNTFSNNWILQDLPGTSKFTISQVDNVGMVVSNHLYSGPSSSEFTPTDFIQSLNNFISDGTVIIGHKDERLHVMEVDYLGAVIPSRERSITLPNSENCTMEAASIVQTYDNNQPYGYCVLVNLKNNIDNSYTVYLVGLDNTLNVTWTKEVFINNWQVIGIHGHKLVAVPDNGSTNFIILGNATFRETTYGFIYDSKTNTQGVTSSTPKVLIGATYFSCAVMLDLNDDPNALIFAGSTNPLAFDESSNAAFLKTDMNLNIIEQKYYPCSEMQAINVLPSLMELGHTVYLLMSHAMDDPSAPYFYHLLELNEDLEVVSGIKTLEHYQNYYNDHSMRINTKNLLTYTETGGYIIAGQEDDDYDFVLSRVDPNLIGSCGTSFPASVVDLELNDLFEGHLETVANESEDIFMEGTELDLEHICCEERVGPEFDPCAIINTTYLAFGPNNNTDYSEDELIKFTASTYCDYNNVASYDWDFGDGSTSTTSIGEVNHTYNFTSLGTQTYFINLSITFDNGCIIEADPHYINVTKCDSINTLNTVNPVTVACNTCFDLYLYESCMPAYSSTDPDEWYDVATGIRIPAGSFFGPHCPTANQTLRRMSTIYTGSSCSTCIDEVQITISPACTPPPQNEGNYSSIDQNDQNLYLNSKIRIMPNPSNGLFYINFEYLGSIQTYEIAIVDMTGKVVYMKDNLNMNIKESFNLSHLASGIYTVKVIVGDTIQYLKIVKN